MILNGFWAIPFTLLLKVISPIYPIVIQKLYSERIGHFIHDSALELMYSQTTKSLTTKWFYMGKISNSYWGTKIKGSDLNILGGWLKWVDNWNRIIFPKIASSANNSINFSKDIYGIFANSNYRISFTETENSIGRNWLKSKGWIEGQEIVCILVRDSKYLQNYSPLSQKIDWSYHSYRNSEIKAYILGIEWLLSRGIFVIRMGKDMESPLTISNSNFSDYAFDRTRSDFLDIWLFSNCDYLISTGAGLDVLGYINHKPQLYLNYLPFPEIVTWSNAVSAPKKLYWSESCTRLTLEEQVHCSFTKTKDYLDAGIRIDDLSENEILYEIMYFWKIVKGKKGISGKDAAKNDKAWSLLCSSPNSEKFHNWRHPNFSLGREILDSIEA